MEFVKSPNRWEYSYFAGSYKDNKVGGEDWMIQALDSKIGDHQQFAKVIEANLEFLQVQKG